MKPRPLLVAVLFAAAFGCDSQVDPDSIAKSEILHVYTEGKSALVANAHDTTVVMVRIPEGAGPLPIEVVTTQGKFLYSAGKTFKTFADSLEGEYRYARAPLISDSTTGTAYVTATVGTYQETIPIVFQPIP